jgi:hypothetical protein
MSSKSLKVRPARKMAERRALLIVLSLALCISSNVARASCNEATDTYNSAISDLSDTLRRYSRCLSNSNGHDDCSSEFRKLKNAQSDFETAVSQYESECR